MDHKKAEFIAPWANLIVFLLVTTLKCAIASTAGILGKTPLAVLEAHPTEIAPGQYTFAVRVFIYIYQLAWVLYSIRPSCSKAPQILSTSFFLSFSIATIADLLWLIALTIEEFGVAVSFASLTGISLYACLYFGFKSLNRYTDWGEECPQSAPDVWCIHFLVQNGVILYAAWVTFEIALNAAILSEYTLKVNNTVAVIVLLLALYLAIVVWFHYENFVLRAYTRFTFTEYIAFVVAFSSVLSKSWVDGRGSQGLVMFSLVLSSLLLVLRIVLIVVNERTSHTCSKSIARTAVVRAPKSYQLALFSQSFQNV